MHDEKTVNYRQTKISMSEFTYRNDRAFSDQSIFLPTTFRSFPFGINLVFPSDPSTLLLRLSRSRTFWNLLHDRGGLVVEYFRTTEHGPCGHSPPRLPPLPSPVGFDCIFWIANSLNSPTPWWCVTNVFRDRRRRELSWSVCFIPVDPYPTFPDSSGGSYAILFQFLSCLQLVALAIFNKWPSDKFHSRDCFVIASGGFHRNVKFAGR